MRGQSPKYSKEYLQSEIIRLYPTHSVKKIAKILGIGVAHLTPIVREIGFKRDKRTVWTDEKEAKLIELYSNTKNIDIASMLNISTGAIEAKAFMLNLKKTPEFRRIHAAKSMFAQNHTPWNKGKKIGVIPGSEKGFFKKGHLPHNTKSDGTISIRKDKDGKLHEFVRISKNEWIHKKILVYEEHHGKIPEGMCVKVIDGNSMNSNIENLTLITREENMIQNSGSLNLSDEFIANCLTRTKPELKPLVLANKDLILLQRSIYQSQRTWKIQKEQD